MKLKNILTVGITCLAFVFSSSTSFAESETNQPISESINEEYAPSSENTASSEATLDTGNTGMDDYCHCSGIVYDSSGPGSFYGGLVQSKNVLSVLMHCFSIACLASLLWIAFGYSLALTPGDGDWWIGGTDAFFPKGLSIDSLFGDFPGIGLDNVSNDFLPSSHRD